MDTKELTALRTTVADRKRAAELECEVQTGIANAMTALETALHRLSNSWSDTDPGKYGEHWFFVKSYKTAKMTTVVEEVEKMWIAELVDDPAKAKKGRFRDPGRPKDDERVQVPLGKMRDVATASCGHCGLVSPIVGCYEQTYDSSDGDTWELRLHTLCLKCTTLTPIASRTEGGRFL